ncbi:MAG: TIGR04086 family membrane protein [Bacilli bacterium]|nr:TIGR04086 family membrane protein [Bacillales bacterium]MDY2574455.1 TIGR04086 family membrane protein [Bacilli bacterium]
MKRKFTNLSLTFISVIILGVIFSLTISLLSSLQVISITLNDNLLLALSLVLFFIMGLIYGLIEKKKGLLNGLLLTCIYLIVIYSIKLINKDYQISSIYIVLTRSLLIIIGCIIGVNIKSKKNINP